MRVRFRAALGALLAAALWAVSGRLTTTGRPMIANDPHLALGTPSTFYPMGLQAFGRLGVFGSGFPGVPGIVQGYNRHIAWSTTNNAIDVTDTYSEQLVPDPSSPSGLSSLYQGRLEHVIPVPQVFRANQPGNGLRDDLVVVPPGGAIPAATLIVPRRNDGPIISFDQATGAALSVQDVGFSATRELDAFFLFNRARSLQEFRAALRFFDVGSQNVVYADDRGNIAYFTTGEMPLREDLQAGTVNGAPPWFIRDGRGGNECIRQEARPADQALPFAVLPFDEMPQVVNPPAGWFVNANNDPAGLTLDNDPLSTLRPGGGILYLAYGRDHGTPTGLTEGWDAGKPAGIPPTPQQIESSVAATIYALWRARFIASTVDAALAPAGLPTPGSQEVLAALRNLLENFEVRKGAGASGVNFFNVPGVADAADRRDILLLLSVQQPLARLASSEFAAAFGNSTHQSDYRWGKLHRIVFAHPLGGPFSVPRAGGAFPAPLAGLAGIPTDGGFSTVDASSHGARAATLNGFMFSAGPVRRFVGEVRPGRTRAESIWAGGAQRRARRPELHAVPDPLAGQRGDSAEAGRGLGAARRAAGDAAAAAALSAWMRRPRPHAAWRRATRRAAPSAPQRSACGCAREREGVARAQLARGAAGGEPQLAVQHRLIAHRRDPAAVDAFR